MQRVRIQTAQNVDIEYEVASVGDRIVAYLIDSVIIIAYVVGLVLLFVIRAEYFRPQVPSSVTIALGILLFLPVMLYDLILEVFMDGQSFGKRQRKIKVIKLDGSQPGLGSYLLRWLLRMIDMSLLSGGVALVTILFNGKGQRLGDIAAGTTVVKLKPYTTLDDTIFVPLAEDYTPMFPQVAGLDERAIATVKEVLDQTADRQRLHDPDQLLLKTKEKLESVLGVQSGLPPRDFLEIVIRDYNFLQTRDGSGPGRAQPER